ncbi:MAG TPA: gamma-glutamyltransferase [Acidimicrobiia bacterium]|nr:gamma-glutamyltransferase [Acidimicrobiia bacterium]
MGRVAIAAPSALAAAAGAAIADAGGNAVDAAIAASIFASISEPGVCSLGAGGFITVMSPEGESVVYDGQVEMPGRGLPPERFGQGMFEVSMAYGGGTTTLAGPGSVATPGSVAAWAASTTAHGRLPWPELWEPSIGAAVSGFPLPAASHRYLTQGAMEIFGREEASRAAVTGDDGMPLPNGATVHVDGLAESLIQLAEEGPACLHGGDLGRRIADAVEAEGGILTIDDLAAYRVMRRPPLRVASADWTLATVPPPAVGGAAVAAVLRIMGELPDGSWDATAVARLAEALAAVFTYRAARVDREESPEQAVTELLGASTTEQLTGVGAASTIHVSAVDTDGLACSATMSAGYGSGVLPAGTGIWLNNCLGELELNRRGVHALPAGTRLPSNMAPSVAHDGAGRVMAVGTPGADRITSALAMVILNITRLGLSLEDAIAYPRLHVEGWPDHPRAAYEPGLDVSAVTLPTRPFEEPSMFFGGAAAALRHADRTLAAAADPRRTGGTAIAGE